jgi:hypothetical protein
VTGKTEKKLLSMDLVGKERDRLGERSNRHGFMKQNTRLCRSQRDKPRGGSRNRRRWKTWPEKLAEGSPEVRRCTELEVAAREKDFRSGTRASRRRPAYI